MRNVRTEKCEKCEKCPFIFRLNHQHETGLFHFRSYHAFNENNQTMCFEGGTNVSKHQACHLDLWKLRPIQLKTTNPCLCGC